MKTLITGATGFVGSAVLRQLINAGHSMRALVRPNSDLHNLAGLPVESFTGDLTDRPSLDRALKGASPRDLNVGLLQRELIKAGVFWHGRVAYF